MKNLHLKKYLTKRNIIILIIILAVFAIFILRNYKYYAQSNYCKTDSDCQLYECSSCGNKPWIKWNVKNSGVCDKSIPGLKGCTCDSGICKRHYEK
jgi:hypothetical protein